MYFRVDYHDKLKYIVMELFCCCRCVLRVPTALGHKGASKGVNEHIKHV